MRAKYMSSVKRIVVKVGSSSLTNDNGLINIYQLESLVKQISDLHNKGYEVVLVSSGAIAAGLGKLNLSARPSEMPELQAAAAVGQVALIHMYQKCFSEYGIDVAQLLLTREGLDNENRCYHTKNATQSLLASGVVPIVNENDAVAVEEIKFGDNDTLSAMVAHLVGADLLILLSDIDGLYEENPVNNPQADLIEEVTVIDEDIRSKAGVSHSKVGTGGMITKITAAEMAMGHEIHMVIANSSASWVLKDIVEGKKTGTLFVGR